MPGRCTMQARLTSEVTPPPAPGAHLSSGYPKNPRHGLIKPIWLWVKTVLGSHFGVGAPPSLAYCGDWDVHWRYVMLTHGHTTGNLFLGLSRHISVAVPVHPMANCALCYPSVGIVCGGDQSPGPSTPDESTPDGFWSPDQIHLLAPASFWGRRRRNSPGPGKGGSAPAAGETRQELLEYSRRNTAVQGGKRAASGGGGNLYGKPAQKHGGLCVCGKPAYGNGNQIEVCLCEGIVGFPFKLAQAGSEKDTPHSGLLFL